MNLPQILHRIKLWLYFTSNFNLSVTYRQVPYRIHYQRNKKKRPEKTKTYRKALVPGKPT